MHVVKNNKLSLWSIAVYDEVAVWQNTENNITVGDSYWAVDNSDLPNNCALSRSDLSQSRTYYC